MRFNEKVLVLTKKIPRGKVSTYKLIAQALGSQAYRAVGTALKNNSKPIIIPCHRVVKSTGEVGDYSGRGRVKGKIKLLKREGVEVKQGKVVDFEKVLFRFR